MIIVNNKGVRINFDKIETIEIKNERYVIAKTATQEIILAVCKNSEDAEKLIINIDDYYREEMKYKQLKKEYVPDYEVEFSVFFVNDIVDSVEEE